MRRIDDGERSKRGEGGPGGIAALLLFALLCGLMLVLLDGKRGGPAGGEAELSVAPRLLHISQRVQEADDALSADNYGQCREALRSVRGEIGGLLQDLARAGRAP